VVVDITKEESIDALFSEVISTFGTIDTLVNNAGIFSKYSHPHLRVPEAWWDNFEVNLKGTFLMTSRFLRFHEDSTAATIINIVTNPSIVAPGLSGYFLSKTALVRFGEHIAVEYPNVVAYSVNPGTSATDMTLEAFVPFAKDTRL